MSPTLYCGFVAASTLLIAVPGPNVAVIVGTSLDRGTRYGLATVAGTTLAMLPQLALAILGTGALLAASAAWFEALRWLGVGYLAVLALRAWRAPAADLVVRPEPQRSVRGIVLRGFLVSLTNPKTLVFYGAFLPQFVDSDAPAPGQFATLAVTFVALAGGIDSSWALLAGRLRPILTAGGRLRHRVTSAVYAAAGLGLALARRS